MRKRSLKRRAAFILAVLMMFMNCFPTFASEMMDVTDNPEINETVNDIENINASAGDETAEAVSGVSDDEEEPTEESAEIITSGSIEGSTEESSEIKTDEESVSEDDSTSSEQAEYIDEEPEEITPAVSLRATGSLMRLGSVNLLGASNTETSTVSQGNPGEGSGYIWWIRDDSETLVISANEAIAQVTAKADLNSKGIPLSSIKNVVFDTTYGGEYKLENFSFDGFSGITKFTIKKSIYYIGQGVFKDCSSLSQFVVEVGGHFYSNPSDVSGTIYSADQKELIAVPPAYTGELKILSTTEEIRASAAEGCMIKGSLHIPKSVKRILDKAFYGCKNLKLIDFGNRSNSNMSQCEEIGNNAFGNCTSVKKVFIPTVINYQGWHSVSSASIKNDAFAGDSRLEFVFYYAVDTVGDQAKPTETDFTDPAKMNSFAIDFKEHYGLDFSSSTAQTQVVGVTYNSKVVIYNPGTGNWGPDDNKSRCEIVAGDKLPETPVPFSDRPEKKKFIDWISEQETEPIVNPTTYRKDTPITDDRDLKAWYQIIWDVEFQVEDEVDGEVTWVQLGDIAKIQQGKTLSAANIPNPPPKENRTFLYWTRKNTNVDMTKDQVLGLAIKQDEIFRAKYSDACDVKFYYTDRETGKKELISSCVVPQNKIIPNFDKVVSENSAILNEKFPPENYEFLGWYDGNDQWLASYKVTGKLLELVAKYKSFVNIRLYYGDIYRAEYPYVDGSDQEPIVKRITSGQPLRLGPVEDLPHYKFGGWYYEDGRYLGTGIIYPSTDMNLYIKWLPKYEVTFYDSKRDATKIYAKKEVVSGDCLGINLPDGPPDINSNGKNLAFVSWNTAQDGTGRDIARYTPINQNETAYAIYGEGHTVKIYNEDKLLQRAVIKHNKTLGAFPTVSKLGYVLTGWNTDKDGNGDWILPTTPITQTMDIYAIWWDDPNVPNEPQVTVSYNSMGGSAVPDQTLSVNTLITKPADPTWEDHKFVGWFTSPAYENEWDFDHNVITNYMTLYAKWITWTEEDEDNAHSIYWIRMLKGGKAPLTQYFRESGLKFSYDKKIVSVQKNGQVVKGKKVGETLITAYKVDGSEYPVKVRVFVLKQELQNMYAYNTSTILNAPDFLTVSGFLPDRWESSKTSVATIDPKTGIIKVRGRGKSKIKAYYQNKAVTATLYSEVPMFAKKFYIFKTGQSKKIKIKRVKKYDIVSWNIITTPQDDISQNKAGYAEVDNNGVVTAVSAGEVTLEAKVYGQTITTKIHIEPPVLKTKQLEIKINKTKKLKLSRTKLKYVEWKSSNDNVAYVDPTTGKVYAINTGRVTLRTTAGGVTNTCNVIVEDPEASKASSLSKTANSTLK